MPLILNHAKQPQGGFSFPDHSGYTIRANSLSALIKTIAEYRAQNSLPPGDPYKEVESYCAIHHNWLISNMGTAPKANEDPIARWIDRQWREPIKIWADAEIAEARYATCEKCPHYVADHPLAQEPKRRLIILGAGHTAGMTGICKVHHWSCALACAAQQLDTHVAVDGCWSLK